MVDEDGDATVGIEAEEPVFLLLVGHDVAGEGETVSQSKNVDIELWVARVEMTYMRVCVHSVP